MEADRTEAVGRSPDLLGGEAGGVFCEILASHLEGIKQRREEGVDARERAAQPRFRLRIDLGFRLRFWCVH
jgi:hypothetical protein